MRVFGNTNLVAQDYPSTSISVSLSYRDYPDSICVRKHLIKSIGIVHVNLASDCDRSDRKLTRPPKDVKTVVYQNR